MMNRAWLDLRREEAIEPELEIVDPHHHLWDFESRFGRYDLDDLVADTGLGHQVTETVFIDCGSNYLPDGPRHLRPIGETRWAAAKADESDRTPGTRITAIVSHADLLLGGAVADVLEAHVTAGNGRFRGIRHSGARADDPAVPPSRVEPPLGLYQDPDFIEGARTLASMGLSFEAWQYHFQLGDVAELAAAVPDLVIVVNHLGGPLGVGRYAGSLDEVRQQMQSGLAVLAGFDNVYLKVGGIGMTRYGAGWEHDDLPPTSDQVLAHWGDDLRFGIDTFGPSRCMFESNYPVDGESVGYDVLWNAFKKVSAHYSHEERTSLFSGTARHVYRL